MPTAHGASPPRPSSPHSHEYSEASLSEGSHDDDEFVCVDLSEIRKDVQCPICLGVIRKTRTVMECLHRFCRICIDKSMRLGNNECPVCRTHCASRRSLRDDLNFDAVVAALYPDLDSYEEEELALREEDKLRNRQLQASIAETSLRQSDAIVRRSTTAKATAAAIVRKAQRKLRNLRNRNMGIGQGEDCRYSNSEEDVDEEDTLDIDDEQLRPMEDVPKKNGFRRQKRKAPNFVLDSSRTEASSDNDQVEHDKCLQLDQKQVDFDSKKKASTSTPGRMRLVTWARAGARSHMRNRHVQSTRATVLLESILARQDLDDELDVHLMLQPCDNPEGEDKLPNLEMPNLCCSAHATVHHICKFLRIRLCLAPTAELEVLVANPNEPDKEVKPSQQLKGTTCNAGALSSQHMEVIQPHTTIGQINEDIWCYPGNLVLMYRCKA